MQDIKTEVEKRSMPLKDIWKGFKSGLVRLVRRNGDELFDYSCLITECRRYFQFDNGRKPSDETSHIFVSAVLAHQHGERMATFIGNAKETFDYWANSGKGTERELEFEAWSDQWNNELGRRIGMFVKKHGLPTTDIASMVSDAFDTRGVANGRVDPRYSEGGYGRSPSWEQPSQKWFKNTLQGCSYSTQEKLTIPMLKECRTRNAKDFLTPN